MSVFTSLICDKFHAALNNPTIDIDVFLESNDIFVVVGKGVVFVNVSEEDDDFCFVSEKEVVVFSKASSR